MEIFSAKIKRGFLSLLFLLAGISLLFVSCSEDPVDPSEEDTYTTRTYIVVFPWTGNTSGNTGLLSYFMGNLDEMAAAIVDQKGLRHERVVVFMQTSKSTASLREIVYERGQCSYRLLKEYQNINVAESGRLSQVLTDARSSAPADEYAMILGAHGCGWTHVDDWANYPYRAKGFNYEDENGQPLTRTADSSDPEPFTRFFGSVSAKEYEINVETLAAEISHADMHFQYILFDVCYMANIETAYALRNATDYLIATASEIMSYGMPYRQMWKPLTGAISYEGICQSFYEFYNTYRMPYGCIAVVDCRQIDEMASVMQRINQSYTFDTSMLDELQVLDGFQLIDAASIFYDMEDYVSHLCPDEVLLADFRQQMQRLVPYRQTTASVPTSLSGMLSTIPVEHFCGLTISDPSENPVAVKGRVNTEWYQATH